MLLRIIFIGLLFINSANCQSVERYCTTSGRAQSTSFVLLESSIGEPMVTTFSDATLLLNQGFLQPSINITSDVAEFLYTLDISVFPNPVATNLTLIINNPQADMAYGLYSSSGKLLKYATINSSSFEISMEGMAAGMYFLDIVFLRQQMHQAIKINKM